MVSTSSGRAVPGGVNHRSISRQSRQASIAQIAQKRPHIDAPRGGPGALDPAFGCGQHFARCAGAQSRHAVGWAAAMR